MRPRHGFRTGLMTIGLTASAYLSIAANSLAGEGTWTRKSDMPTARGYLSTAVVNGKIYAVGGALGSTTGCSTVEEYDPATDVWTRKANLPTERSGLSASVVGGALYAIGGATSPLGTACSSVYSYDPTTDTWEQKADMPTARIVLSTCVVNGKIYAIGGAPTGGNGALNNVEEYDPTSDTWVQKAPMPTARGFLCVSVVNGRIYAIGGASTKFGPVLTTVEEYDPVTDTWTTRANMPTARGWLASSPMGGRIYVIGGASAAATLQNLSAVEEYDPVTDTWTSRADMPTARRILSASTVDGRIYVIGGLAGAWGTAAIPTGIVEEYDMRPPPPDFNGDGVVDGADVLVMAKYWAQDDPMCDIAPQPFGDGTVDVQDLIALADHIGEAVNDPTLVAHWPLDEVEGVIAHDAAGLNHASVIGGATWQPEGGKVGGALQCDGLDDCALTEFILNPAGGLFSVFAWVKDGTPGQVVLSQEVGANWLMTDIVGALGTEVKEPGRQGQALWSQTVVTDGRWHRVGLVWDGVNRILYVDEAQVAADAQTHLADSLGGLLIGAGSDLAPGTFWLGLIDDVRIYNRALKP